MLESHKYMKTETKDLLKSVGSNAAGTVVGAAVIAIFVFFSGKIELFVAYWKEVAFSTLLIFTVLTLVAWFRNLLKMQRELEVIKSVLQINWHTNAIKKIREDLIRTMEAVSGGNISSLKRKIVELEIENFRSGHQVGELAGLIEKLHMDLKTDVHVEDDLMEIREYIKKSGMPHYYIEKLNKVLNLVSEDYSMFKKDILTLSQEKLYKC